MGLFLNLWAMIHSFFHKHNPIATIAQLILCVMVLPILCKILAWVSVDGLDYLIGLLSELPIAETWIDLITALTDVPSKISMTQVAGMYGEIMDYTYAAGLETVVAGLCIDIVKYIGVHLRVRGIPLLQAIIGVFLGCFLMQLCDITTHSALYTLMSLLLIADLVLIWAIPGGGLFSKIAATLVGLGVKLLETLAVLGYVISTFLYAQGFLLTRIYIPVFSFSLVFLAVLALLDYWLLTPIKNSLLL